MEREETPEDIFSQIDGDKPNLPIKSTVTQSSAKVDEGVRTIEEKVLHGQNVINDLRSNITKNENAIKYSCFALGVAFSYAINQCTININISVTVYWLSGVILIVTALLLIADEALPLIVLIRFAVFAFGGHYFMMWMTSIDGHYFGFFTSDVCRYPFSIDVATGVIAGIFIGYIWKSFEEIRAARKR